ncbi:TadE/TadG family type IV pilus assembly protein [Sphingomonas nostoxanthinifaciens]|uniref:TadE/TadG family type IV pilus assembly protein n=1 Tax=Sphingomonas nostoxanthinifaciens TaxID=2872652 RepID=UPI001CC1F2CB|nr:TadE/TadG family type IV pilus assembly protein [Sphingomonas nostoxanthinifaciens]UAK26392.1 pilus assembly protein [Sphingomonas nostoxanthinifaciens]
MAIGRISAKKLASDTRGLAVLEFALVAPLLLTILFGIAGYGGYFWRAHAVQQVANDTARAALPGLTAAERQSLALAAFSIDLPAVGLDPTRATATVAEANGIVTVNVSYDGSRDGFLNLSLVPLPSKLIKRLAAVRLGGL